MHSLECLLVLLSERIEQETGKRELAEAALTLATASHGYAPPFGEETLGKMASDWLARYARPIASSEPLEH